MDASAPLILQWLEGSALGLGIRQSVWVYPAANVGHVLAVVAFGAAVAVLDLVLLGVVKAHGRASALAAARRVAMGLLGLVVLSGAVLFLAEASHVFLNRVFQLKLALIALAGVNAAWLGGRAVAAARALPDEAPLPSYARAAALISLGLWITVVGLGRFIAYV